MHALARGRIAAAALLLCALASGRAAAQDIVISGVVDGPLPGGIPKAVELYVINDVPDLSVYGVSSANNGAGPSSAPEFTLPSAAATAGSYLYVASESTAFTDFFGFAPDFTSGAASINGDDAIELFENGVVVDVFGDVSVDGSGQPWEYLDGWAYRTNDTGPDGTTFVLGNWTFSGPNALDGATDNASAAVPFPIASHSNDGSGAGGGGGGSPGVAGVVINEIHADPDSAEGDANGDGTAQFSDDEYVEIVNVTGDTLDLSGWALADGVTTRHVFPAGTTVADGCAIVVFGGGTPTGDFGGASTQVATDGALGLNNGGDTITITTNTGALAVTVGYGSEGGDNQSLTRSPDITGPFAKHLSVAPTRFSAGTALDGTPFAGCESAAIDAAVFEVQGDGAVSPLAGQNVRVEGIVTGDFQDGDADETRNLRGFYLQDALGDGDPATSDGVFVFDGSTPGLDVSVGDRVAVTGGVVEFFGETQISAVGVEALGTAAAPAPVVVALPSADVLLGDDGEYIPDLEAFEGMLVEIAGPLTVTDLFNLDRFGEMHLVSGGRPQQFTNINAPDAVALDAYLRDLGSRSIMLDDGQSVQNPDPIRYPPPGLPNDVGAVVRGGDDVTGVVGNLRFSRGSGGSGDALYRLMPTGEPVFTATNPRPDAPDVAGALRVAALNALNFFTTIDESGARCGPEATGCRGADSPLEFERQLAKLVLAIEALDADVVGLIELENNPSASLAALVDALNVAAGPDTWAFVDTGVIGTDAIKVGMIYRPAEAAPEGAFAVLDASVDPRFVDTRNRPVLAQTFRDSSTAGLVTVAVTHLKSKGSPCADIGDPDTGDGQGNCNLTRATASQATIDWLAADPTGSGSANAIVVGDFNAYLREDPLQAYRDAGWSNLLEQFVGVDAYTFTFDRQIGALDHAVASPELAPQVVDTAVWHSNTDEADAIDYNLDFGRNPDIYDGTSPARASDHDAVVVGLELLGDLDGDGVENGADLCPATVIPEDVPTRFLLPLRFALTDGDDVFDVGLPRIFGGIRITTADTAGCSCSQIIDALDARAFNRKFGCGLITLVRWNRLISE